MVLRRHRVSQRVAITLWHLRRHALCLRSVFNPDKGQQERSLYLLSDRLPGFNVLSPPPSPDRACVGESGRRDRFRGYGPCPPQEKPRSFCCAVRGGFGTEGPRRVGPCDWRPGLIRLLSLDSALPHCPSEQYDHPTATPVAGSEANLAVGPMAARVACFVLSRSKRERHGMAEPGWRARLCGGVAVQFEATRIRHAGAGYRPTRAGPLPPSSPATVRRSGRVCGSVGACPARLRPRVLHRERWCRQ